MAARKTLQFIVIESEAGKRLDALLPARFFDEPLSRSRAARLITENHVTVNEKAAKPSYLVRVDDRITISIPEKKPSALTPDEVALDVLYEDKDLIAVNKPPGMVVHPAPGHPEKTLVNALLHHCPDITGVGDTLRPGIVHRLDKDTSGVMVAAKNDAAMAGLAAQFKARSLQKTYLALVYGRMKETNGEIDLPIGRHPIHRKKMQAGHPKGREALTLWQVEREFKEAALLRVVIKTGRTHQIRVHLAAMDHPVLGDSLYAGKRKLALKIARQMLHSHELTLDHPVTGERLELVAPLPQDMQEVMQALTRF